MTETPLAGPVTGQQDTDLNEGREALLTLVQQTRRYLNILSEDLPLLLYNTEETCAALSMLARQGSGNRIRILVHNPDNLIAHAPRLLALLRRLPSKIEARRLDELPASHSCFLTGDNQQALLFVNEAQGKAIYHPENRPLVQQLTETFETAWNRAEIIPELRQLSL